MREIKFRAWEKKTKQMIPVYNIHFFAKTINVGYPWRFFDEVELMEYTGLKDINSKEIFEGDIARGICTNTLYKVAFVKGGFFLSDIKDPNSNLQLLWDTNNLVKVIGNIYENPELLEVAE